MTKLNGLLITACIAILLMIAVQIAWVKSARNLIEDQFNNKVNMALCNTVEKIAESGSCKAVVSCEQDSSSCAAALRSMIHEPEFVQALQSNLSFYQIDLPYEVTIAKQNNSKKAVPDFSCSLGPVMALDDHWLQLIFKSKKEYFIAKIWPMVLISGLIIFGVIFLIVYAIRKLFLEKKIRQNNQHYFNQMTHEFNTPLTNIQLALKLLKRKNKEDKNSYLDIIEMQCHQLHEQVENVLHLSKIEKGQLQIQWDTLDLVHIIDEAIQSMKLHIDQKQAEVLLDYKQDAPLSIKGDRIHLRNVFRNLLDNSLKYAIDYPVIRIQIENTNDHYIVKFNDNGIGIPKEEQENVFDTHYRASNHVESTIKGFGIGLAYVKKVIELHKGTIEVVKNQLQGTCIQVSIPS